MDLKFVLTSDKPEDIIEGIKTEVVRRLNAVQNQQGITLTARQSANLAGQYIALIGVINLLTNLVVKPEVERCPCGCICDCSGQRREVCSCTCYDG